MFWPASADGRDAPRGQLAIEVRDFRIAQRLKGVDLRTDHTGQFLENGVRLQGRRELAQSDHRRQSAQTAQWIRALIESPRPAFPKVGNKDSLLDVQYRLVQRGRPLADVRCIRLT